MNDVRISEVGRVERRHIVGTVDPFPVYEVASGQFDRIGPKEVGVHADVSRGGVGRTSRVNSHAQESRQESGRDKAASDCRRQHPGW